MNVTLRQLRVFESVARHLSFTRASEELFLTQPAVSMQIKQLESQVGLPLFEQLGKRIYLTEAGRELVGFARRIMRELREAQLVMEELQGLNRGRLGVAVATTANYFATHLLAAFSRRNPGVSFSLDVTNREGLLRLLMENERDVVIMGQPPEGQELVADAFMANPLVVIANPDHPLTREHDIPPERLQNELFVVRERGSGTRVAMERFFARQGVQLQSEMEMSSNEALKQAVQAGLGLGLVSQHTLAMELSLGCLAILDVVGFPIQRQWYVVHRAGKRLSPVAAEFRRFVLEEAEDHWQLPQQPTDSSA
ncbi:LysR family transcriptional regulator [Alkalilimnicola ehrlichii MLHE-1]|uniref:Transcriptional regulator, LysR family n=1 Tax=Alkalilimnicola ehrlichii (strain ATCC BAA-1101 / DSM 17681 / MLHE-1) TaxID=187272 RepID=Q0A4R2_ALKEH|nr:LysR family transcriptional regulator [Alkalilimnicola ehrlichii]ABI58175.1 transcriptional regulator, LysR family [Alkalilimnicola ehrlichii MLHE-1]